MVRKNTYYSTKKKKKKNFTHQLINIDYKSGYPFGCQRVEYVLPYKRFISIIINDHSLQEENVSFPFFYFSVFLFASMPSSFWFQARE